MLLYKFIRVDVQHSRKGDAMSFSIKQLRANWPEMALRASVNGWKVPAITMVVIAGMGGLDLGFWGFIDHQVWILICICTLPVLLVLVPVSWMWGVMKESTWSARRFLRKDRVMVRSLKAGRITYACVVTGALLALLCASITFGVWYSREDLAPNTDLEAFTIWFSLVAIVLFMIAIGLAIQWLAKLNCASGNNAELAKENSC